MYSLLARVWRTFGGALQWRILWLFHSKFILGVSAVVFDDAGGILLLRHKFWKSHSWGLPSGYAVKGESLEETVQREVKEETNLDVEVGRLLRLKSGFRLRLEVSFEARLTGGVLSLDQKEVSAAAFFSRDALPPGLLPSHRELIDKLPRETTRARPSR